MGKNNNKGSGAKRDDAAIRAAGELAENIIDTVREPLIVLDGDLRVVSANRSFYNIFRVKPDQTEKRLIYELGSCQWDMPELRRLLEDIIPDQMSFDDFEVEHDFPVIGRRVMLLNARRIPRPPGRPEIILLAIEDITERRRLEDMLEASEERYRRAFETAQDGMLLVDKTSGRILNSNAAAQTLLGYSRENLSEKKLWDIGVMEDEAAFRDAAPLLEEKGFVYYEDAPVRTSEGRGISADVYMIDKAKVIQCNIRDITERKKAEDALKKSEEKIRTMLQSVPDHMSMMDKDLNIVWANEVARKIFGDDIVGKKCYKVYHGREEPCEPYPCITLKAFQDGKVHEHDTQVIDKDGRTIYFHCTANVALKDPEGKPQAVLEISRDITESKKAEEELKKRFHQLEVFHKAAVDRELKMKKLEGRIAELEAKLEKR